MSLLQGLFGPPDIEKLKAGRDIGGLVKALGYQKDAAVREAAALALMEMGEGWKALRALGQMSDDRAVEPLIAIVDNDTGDLRREAIRALGKWADARVEEALLGVVATADPSTRELALKTLIGIGWQPDQSQAGAYYLIGKERWDECAAVGAPAVEPLIEVFNINPNDLARLGLAALLGKRREFERDLAAIAEAHRGAARALGQIGDARAVAALMFVASGEPVFLIIQRAHHSQRYETSDGYAYPDPAEFIRSIATPRYDAAKEAAIWALGEIGAPEATEVLKDAAESRSPRVKSAAKQALSKLGAAVEKAAPRRARAPAASTPVQHYNKGVSLYAAGKYKQAKQAFIRCLEAGAYQMQAAYASGLCDQKMGRKPALPEELAGRENETGVVYVASNLACYLLGEGHRAALQKAGEKSAVSATIQGCEYVVETTSDAAWGGFLHFAKRADGPTWVLIHPVAEAGLTETDRYLISLLERASSLPLSPLPEEGLHEFPV